MERMKILIVDDTPENLQVLYRALKEEYEIFSATNGRKALELVRSQRPDLVLLDVMMPEMDGYQVNEALKDDPCTREIPVIFITAKTDSESETLALSAGAVDFIHKPFNTRAVGARVRLHIELARHREHLEELVHARTRDLAEARDAAESADRAKSAFLANMGHELRTPMNHIIGIGHLLKSRITDERSAALLAKLQQSSQHLLGLLSDILEYSRSEAGLIRIEAIDFEPRELLNQAIAGIREAAADKGLVIDVKFDPALPPLLRGDPIRLRQVLDSLLDNAVKFSQDGVVSVRASQSALHGDSSVMRVEIEDHGIGMTPEVQAGVFQLFSQGDGSSTRKYGGTGLGLALSKRLVSLMAGEIGFSSDPGRGSTFWFSVRLPGRRMQPADGMTPGDLDWRRVGEIADYLERLLADDDAQAVILWDEFRPLLEPVLKDGSTRFVDALERFDFQAALQQLRQAVGNSSELSGIG